KRILRLLERKYPVDHWPEVPGLEELTDLSKLHAVWMHEQERIGDPVLPGAANYLAAQETEDAHHEKIHASGASERGVRWPNERDDGALRLQNPKGSLDRVASDCTQYTIVI